MDEQARRLITRTVAVLDQDDAAANRLIEDELEPFIERARSAVTTGEALLAMLRERMATRAVTPVPLDRSSSANGGERTLDLADHVARVLKTTSRDGALLVLLENGPLRVRKLRRRMEELGHPRISNVSSALYKAAHNTTPPLVAHNEDGFYELTSEGKEFAKALLT